MALNRKLRRQLQRSQAKRRKASDASLVGAEQKEFDKAIDDLAVIGGISNQVSTLVAGSPANRQQEWGSMVHAKMCAHARSIGAISQSSMFDHSAIMNLARMMIEGMTMFFYLREEVTPEEWALRSLLLGLHDTVARIKLMRVAQAKNEYADLTQGRSDLVQQIKRNSVYANLPKDQQDKLINGEVIFSRGMHNAARVAGWREETFVGVYNYFSAHTHTAPMSYMRMRMHGVDYYQPSAPQYTSATIAVVTATACLRRVTLRSIDDHPDLIPRVHPGLLQEARQADAATNVFAWGESVDAPIEDPRFPAGGEV